ncbi:MAG: 50S ribosomal protein L18 [Candidatus Omnitrophica bacterium]|nr:50S ribosomal protein L18 [Candidatus Omnitrophota bacterium]MBU0896045.1 50S ribosomal protein L18 [Candidatus Omnitrophota bacterium]MBU1134573.1 50S ribosomal protein L18 [Candidatus Omnitrophota bacterium]MBU1367274.1 50S ribosomal protein L18 [Candidatus Omnitrophota bacterium]MBU1811241.1 50S ribosomal protein L18 [Candidatus Omnitrophota bacterium]
MKVNGRARRHRRITKKMKGSVDKPRLVVFRSKKHIYTQLINDATSRVIASCSTLTKEFKEKKIKTGNKEASLEIGKLLAQKALELKIRDICFDRAGYKYHGRVKALAEGAREGGLKF